MSWWTIRAKEDTQVCSPGGTSTTTKRGAVKGKMRFVRKEEGKKNRLSNTCCARLVKQVAFTSKVRCLQDALRGGIRHNTAKAH
jgi:hypothetical protein